MSFSIWSVKNLSFSLIVKDIEISIVSNLCKNQIVKRSISKNSNKAIGYLIFKAWLIII